MKKKILIFIITYKASYRLLDVYNKIPFKKLKKYKINVLLVMTNLKMIQLNMLVKFIQKIKILN